MGHFFQLDGVAYNLVGNLLHTSLPLQAPPLAIVVCLSTDFCLDVQMGRGGVQSTGMGRIPHHRLL